MDLNLQKKLIEEAVKARKYAYAPYSKFTVGAALLTKEGKIYTGCNVESAAYSPSNCAERLAFFKAVSEGHKEFSAIAVVGGKLNTEPQSFCTPCGVCRQVMIEFCDPKEFEIILVGCNNQCKVITLDELIPMAFSANDIA